MTDKFGDAGDPGDKAKDFGDGTSDDGDTKPGVSITTEELTELRKRDENAQQHIPRLEEDNNSLRQQLADLQARLDSATTLDDVVERIKAEKQQVNADGTVNPDDVINQVEQRLADKARAKVEESNWQSVVSDLTKHYGDWDKANTEIQSKCDELKISTSEATRIAKQSPEAFHKLFGFQGQVRPKQGSATITSQQTSTFDRSNQNKEDLRTQYAEMRRKNPNKYWSIETQAQIRRDLYSD